MLPSLNPNLITSGHLTKVQVKSCQVYLLIHAIVLNLMRKICLPVNHMYLIAMAPLNYEYENGNKGPLTPT